MRHTMKRIIPAIAIMVFTVAGAAAREGMDVKNIRMNRVGGEVTLSFELTAGARTADSRHTLLVTPVITDGTEKAAFPAIAVQGRIAAKTAIETLPAAYGIRNGESVGYTARIPYGEWMTGAELRLEGVDVGCGGAYAVSPELLADNVLWHEPQYETELVEIRPEPVPSTAEKLSRRFQFLHSDENPETALGEDPGNVPAYSPPFASDRRISEEKRNELENLIADERDVSIKIHFRQNRRAVELDYLDNFNSLVELVSVLRAIEASGTDKVTRVVIAGFASPEGDTELNNRLAWERATALKAFLTEHSLLDPAKVFLYNGSVDWGGLRELIAGSGMASKRQVLDIIDNIPVWDAKTGRGRRGELMRLDRGEPYRYISREFFPMMRQASFIKVYYEKK